MGILKELFVQPLVKDGLLADLVDVGHDDVELSAKRDVSREPRDKIGRWTTGAGVAKKTATEHHTRSLQELQSLPTDELDRAAFGVTTGDVIVSDPDELHVVYKSDLDNATYAMEQSGKSPAEWAKTIKRSKPIDVVIKGGKKTIADGHHRYLAAKILGMPLKVRIVDVADNPIEWIYKNAINDGRAVHGDAGDGFPGLAGKTITEEPPVSPVQQAKKSTKDSFLELVSRPGWTYLGAAGFFTRTYPEGTVQLEFKPLSDESWGNTWSLAFIHTEGKSRGKGLASRALKEITDAADEHGMKILGYVSPQGKGGLNKRQLFAWYKRHGFERQPYDMGGGLSDDIERKAQRVTLSSVQSVLWDENREVLRHPRGKSGQWIKAGHGSEPWDIDPDDITGLPYDDLVAVDDQIAKKYAELYWKKRGLGGQSITNEELQLLDRLDNALTPALHDAMRQHEQVIKERQAAASQTIVSGKPWAVTRKQFLAHHVTGSISSDAYQNMMAEGGMSFIKKDNFPKLLNMLSVNGRNVEMRIEREPTRHVKSNSDGDIARDDNGKAILMTDEEARQKGLSLFSITVGAFDGDQPVGYAGDEWGATGVYVKEKYQRSGLGLELLDAFMRESGRLQSGRKLGQMTNAGRNTAAAWHKHLVKKAISEGKPVPQEVLADYPDLAALKLTPEEDYAKNGTRAKAFKSWFGDWESAAANASKVVNSAGEPQETNPIPGTGSKVIRDGVPVAVYHGTAKGGWDAFDKSKLNSDCLYGPGFYFTEDKTVAEGYQEKGRPKALNRPLTDSDMATAEQWLEDHLDSQPAWVMSSLHAAFIKGSNALADKLANASESQSLAANLCKKLGVTTLGGGSPEIKIVYLNIRKPIAIDERLSKRDAERLGYAIESMFEFDSLNNDIVEELKWRSHRGDSVEQALEYITNQVPIHKTRQKGIGSVEVMSKKHYPAIFAKAGFDGITHIGGSRYGGNKHKHKVWIAFEPTQIKSVNNRGTFNKDDANINLSGTEPLTFAEQREVVDDHQQAADKLAEKVITKAQKAGASISSAIRRDTIALMRRLTKEMPIERQLLMMFLREFRLILRRHEPTLARVISDAQLAAFLQGGQSALSMLPASTAPMLDQMVSFYDRLKSGDKLPPAPPMWELPAGYSEAEPTVTFPIIDAAVADLARRRLLTSDEYYQANYKTRVEGFTVSRMASLDAIERVRDALAEAVAKGDTLETFREKTQQAFDASGLSPSRQETVFRTGIMGAYARGQKAVVETPLVNSVAVFAWRSEIRDSRLTSLCDVLSTSGFQGTSIYLTDSELWRRVAPVSHFG